MVVANPFTLGIAREFSKTPGPRSKREGAFSGEEFLAKYLLPRFDEAAEKNLKLLVDLDGGYGYATSFLEESFGGLARIRGAAHVLEHLEIKSEEEPYLADDIRKYIRTA